MDTRDIEFWRRAAAGAASNPLAWRSRAGGLWRSAELVLAEHREDIRRLLNLERLEDSLPEPVGHVHMMLAGLALEALVKGHIVCISPVSAGDSTTLQLPWKGKHLGAALVELAGLDLSTAECELIERLGLFVRWAGRYPVPKNAAELRPRAPGIAAASWSSEDWVLISALYHRWSAALTEPARARELNLQAEAAREREERYRELKRRLQDYPQHQIDGSSVWEDPGAPDEPGAAMGCAGCGGQAVNLNRRRFALRCRCGTLYECVYQWDASLGRELPVIYDYPPRQEAA